MPDTRVVEINGVKMELDLRQATTIDTYKVGQNIKILMKEYGGTYKSHPGLIVGFDNFKNLPTIVIAYFERSYGSQADIKFAYLNRESKDIEITSMVEDEVPVNREEGIATFDRAITQKVRELDDLKAKRSYFVQHFGNTQE